MSEPPEICIYQTDNRQQPQYPYEFIPANIQGNRRVCQIMGWHHEFRIMKPEYYAHSHPATGKIFMVRDFLVEMLEKQRVKQVGTESSVTKRPTIMVFLDTDAWVQNPARLQALVTEMVRDGKQGAFSRDPYLKKNTFVNSGSFILTVNKTAVEMYNAIIKKINLDPQYQNNWPWDQVYVSGFVWENKDQFFIFKPDVLNTPFGAILRHNWHKTSRKIRDEIFALCYLPVVHSKEEGAVGIMEGDLDAAVYPNITENGYDFLDFD